MLRYPLISKTRSQGVTEPTLATLILACWYALQLTEIILLKIINTTYTKQKWTGKVT
jgi:hypothetical protein